MVCLTELLCWNVQRIFQIFWGVVDRHAVYGDVVDVWGVVNAPACHAINEWPQLGLFAGAVAGDESRPSVPLGSSKALFLPCLLPALLWSYSSEWVSEKPWFAIFQRICGRRFLLLCTPHITIPPSSVSITEFVAVRLRHIHTAYFAKRRPCSIGFSI